jgi:hypothetical protein
MEECIARRARASRFELSAFLVFAVESAGDARADGCRGRQDLNAGPGRSTTVILADQLFANGLEAGNTST